MNPSLSLALILLLAVFPSGTTSANVDVAVEPQPPEPVKCDDRFCDRAPEHLENFVANFYVWYVADIQKLRRDRSTAYFEYQQKIMGEVLSPKAASSYRAAYRKMDGENASPDCLDADSEQIFCTLYPPDTWLGEVTAHAQNIATNGATIIVTLPQAHMGQQIVPSYKLLLNLKPTKGAWRIDRVTDRVRNDK